MPIKSFTEFVIEETQKEVVFAFGRFNPPTIGHEKLLEKAAEVAKGRPYRVYASRAEDTKKNPLSLTEKVRYMRKMFPRHARSIMADSDISDALQVCSRLYTQGFTKVSMVVSEDRAESLRTLLNTYNGKTQPNGGFYNFREGVNIVSVIANDPDSDNSSGVSSAVLREAAASNDLELFSKGLPSVLEEKQALFNAVRLGLGLKETKTFRKHIRLETVSDRREAYVNGEIFNLGDEVIITESNEIGRVAQRGPNYLVVAMHDGRRVRKWLNGVELVESEVIPDVSPAKPSVIEYDRNAGPGKPISKLRKA